MQNFKIKNLFSSSTQKTAIISFIVTIAYLIISLLLMLLVSNQELFPGAVLAPNILGFFIFIFGIAFISIVALIVMGILFYKYRVKKYILVLLLGLILYVGLSIFSYSAFDISLINIIGLFASDSSVSDYLSLIFTPLMTSISFSIISIVFNDIFSSRAQVSRAKKL